MPKDSCIDHLRRGDFIILRSHMVDLLGGDHCSAVILAYFEHATNGELDRFSRQGIEGQEPWVTATMSSIYEETIKLYSIRRLQERIAWVVSLGFLREGVSAQVGKVKSYLLNVAKLNDAIKGRFVFNFSEYIGQMSDGPSDATSDATYVSLSDESGALKSIGTKEKEEERINTPPSSSQNSEPTISTSDQDSLSSEDLKAVIGRVVREVPGVRSISKGIRDEIEAGLTSLHPGWSEPQVWAVFNRWRESGVDRDGWEPRRKVAAFMAYLRAIYPDTVPVAPQAEPATPSLTPSRHSAAGKSSEPLLESRFGFPARWNELVPEAPADPALFPSCPKSYRDPVFVARFDEICTKARKLIQEGADIKFGFLLKESAGRFRWQELLADELNWMRPKGAAKSNGGTTAGGKDIFDEAIALVMKGKKP